jgi:Uma2 family endonuclease
MAVRIGADYTAEYLWEAPDDGNRYEVIEGELIVTTAPDWIHQRVSSRLNILLGSHIYGHGLGEIVAAPVGVILGPRSGVQPDLVYVSNARRHIITRRGIEGTPDLVVEILSAGTAATDRGAKMRTYAALGVPWYWIVDPVARTLESYRLDGGVYTLSGTYGPSSVFEPDLFPGLQVPMDQL